MNSAKHMDQYLVARVEKAKQVLMKVNNEIMHRQLSNANVDQKPLAKRLFNAQYFVHELYYYLGFEPVEIAGQTGITLSTVLDLLSESTRQLNNNDFNRLTYFYYAAKHEKVLPQASKAKNQQITFQKNELLTESQKIELDSLAGFMQTASEIGFRQLMFNEHVYKQKVICSQKDAHNEEC